MLAHRLRRRPNIETTLFQRVCFLGLRLFWNTPRNSLVYIRTCNQNLSHRLNPRFALMGNVTYLK